MSGYSAVAPPRPGGTVVLLDFEYPSTLNPLMAQTDVELRLSGLLFARSFGRIRTWRGRCPPWRTAACAWRAMGAR